MVTQKAGRNEIKIDLVGVSFHQAVLCRSHPGAFPHMEAALSQFPDRETYCQFVVEYQDANNIRRYILEEV